MENNLPHNQKLQKISNQLKKIFFLKVIKKKNSNNLPMNLHPSDSSLKIKQYKIPEELQYAYEKYNALMEEIQNLQQQAMLKLEKIGFGKYAVDLLESIYNKTHIN